MLSANVVNNSMCAFFQQRSGVIPQEDDALELPPERSLRQAGPATAPRPNDYDAGLAKWSLWRRKGGDPIAWNQRISINFVALLVIEHDVGDKTKIPAEESDEVDADPLIPRDRVTPRRGKSGRSIQEQAV